MKSTVEPVEGNKVKLSIEVDRDAFEKEVDAAFKRIAREVRMPGFRPGKAPRKLLEARIGLEAARGDAIEHAVPRYYSDAVIEHDVDVIAAPDFDVTTTVEDEELAFTAVVEIRPTVNPAGYDSLRVTVPSPDVTEEDVDDRVQQLRENFATLEVVERPAADGDVVTIDIAGTRNGEAVEGTVADDYTYEVGSGTVVPELDENLRGANVGDELEFSAQPPIEDAEPIDFAVTVTEVREKVLPDIDDEWAAEASEFETLDELRADLRTRLEPFKKYQTAMALQNNTVDALAELVDEEAPEPLVEAEMQRRLEDLTQRLLSNGIRPEDYLAAMDGGPEAFFAEMRQASTRAVKVDLALRAIGVAQEIDVPDEDLENQYELIAARGGLKAQQVRKQFERNGQVAALRSEMRNHRALEWLIEQVELVDEQGGAIDRSVLEPPADADDQPGAGDDPDSATEDAE